MDATVRLRPRSAPISPPTIPGARLLGGPARRRLAALERARRSGPAVSAAPGKLSRARGAGSPSGGVFRRRERAFLRRRLCRQFRRPDDAAAEGRSPRARCPGACQRPRGVRAGRPRREVAPQRRRTPSRARSWAGARRAETARLDRGRKPLQHGRRLRPAR